MSHQDSCDIPIEIFHGLGLSQVIVDNEVMIPTPQNAKKSYATIYCIFGLPHVTFTR
jgi:hypothetical protein